MKLYSKQLWHVIEKWPLLHYYHHGTGVNSCPLRVASASLLNSFVERTPKFFPCVKLKFGQTRSPASFFLLLNGVIRYLKSQVNWILWIIAVNQMYAHLAVWSQSFCKYWCWQCCWCLACYVSGMNHYLWQTLLLVELSSRSIHLITVSQQ